MRYAAFVRGTAISPRRADPGAAAAARAVIGQASGTRLAARQGSAVLAAYGIPTPPEALALSRSEAVAIAEHMGYPVAAKVEAPSVAHKAHAGGVMLGLETRSAVEAAFDRLIGVAADVEGVLIQHMVAGGQAEIIVGMSRDPQFGAVIACGLGGIFVETLRDVQLLLPPVNVAEAQAALSRLRGATVLERTDVDAAVDVLVRFSELCVDLQDIVTEIDLNPLIVRSIDQGAIAVDSLFVLDG